jgi:hypothetical protein
MPPAALPHVCDVALAAWDKINMGAEYQGSYTKIQQGPTKPYSDFIGRLEESIEKQVRGYQTQKILLHQLAFDNANEDCQSLIRPFKETGDIMDYLKACCNVGTFKNKARVAALETMAIQKQKAAKCFNCGKSGHMKKQSKLPAQNNDYNKPGNPSLPGICPRCKRGRHWVKECSSKMDREGNLLSIK